MGKHINLFETKTKEELLELYKEFLEAERKSGIPEDSELGKIKLEYEKDFGANTVLMLQIELTHTISDLQYKDNAKQPLNQIFKVKFGGEDMFKIKDTEERCFYCSGYNRSDKRVRALRIQNDDGELKEICHCNNCLREFVRELYKDGNFMLEIN